MKNKRTSDINGKMFIVPTPIGNLEDITLKALRVLKEVDLILAEDTRQTLKLLQHYQINTSLKSYHQYNEHFIKDKIIYELKQGKLIALVSDAGTPGISDPGYLIVRECLKNKIDIECLPGPTALIPAMVSSGFPCERFVFEGFLPHKKGRRKRLEEIMQNKYTTILYESPFRLIKTLEDLNLLNIQNKPICVCRELTKIHETIIRGTINEVLTFFKTNPPKGEIVIIIGTSLEELS